MDPTWISNKVKIKKPDFKISFNFSNFYGDVKRTQEINTNAFGKIEFQRAINKNGGKVSYSRTFR